MRSLRFFALCIFGALLPELLAYMPGPDNIRKCPHCSALFREHTTISGNTFGAVVWADGCMEAPMLPEWPLLVKCAKCGKLIWVRESELVGSDGFIVVEEQTEGARDPREQWKDVGDFDVPSEADLLATATALRDSPQKEKYVRMWAWRIRNGEIRGRPTATMGWTEARMENVRRLQQLLDVKDPWQRLLHAEIDRELGNFETCLKQLEGDFGNINPALIGTIKRLAKERSSAILQVTKAEN